MATAAIEKGKAPSGWDRIRAAAPGVVAFVAVLAIIRWGLMFLADRAGPEPRIIRLYEMLGLTGAAEAIRDRGMTAVTGRTIIAIVALVIGVGGVWALFISANYAIDKALPLTIRERVRPWIFAGPAIALVGFFLLFPGVLTIYFSATRDRGFLGNYQWAFTDPAMQIALRNNALWLIIGTTGSVVIGLAFAALVDRVKREALAKTFIFLPLAISFVGASVIWRFVYAWQPPGQPQIGLVNAFLGNFGIEPIAWLQTVPINTLALIVIMIWLQTGFAMVILSAALKGVPSEVMEAGRIDGAGEVQLFFKVILPMIRPTTITVATTIFIAILKVFDIVYVLGGARSQSQVVALSMFQEMFIFNRLGQASAAAVVLLLAVIPILVINIRNMREQGLGS